MKDLLSIPIFNKLNSKEIEYLHHISIVKKLKNGEILFFEGEESKKLYLILDGSIEVYKTDKNSNIIALKQFFPFSFIAEVSNYTNIPFPASSKSINNSTVLVIDYLKFKEKLLYHPSIVPSILNSVSNKVLSLEKVITEHLTMDATQRVSKFIYEKESLFKTSKHNKIAKKLNITPVTFSRILKKLREKKIISSDNSIINKNLLKKSFS